MDRTDAEAVLVRQDGDTGDVFVINTTAAKVLIGGATAPGTYDALTIGGVGLSIADNGMAKFQMGRFSGGVPFSFFKLSSTSTGYRWTNSADSVDLMQLTNAGQLSLPIVGSTGGITFGGDANIFRGNPNVLETSDAFTIAGELIANSNLIVDGTNTEALLVRANGDSGDVFVVDTSTTAIGFFGTTPAVQAAAYTRNAAVVEDRTLLASASATVVNKNNVLAALIADLQSYGLLQ